MFPASNSSQTIIDCLYKEASRLGVHIELGSRFAHAIKDYDRMILATGSSKEGWDFAKSLGHTIQTPVPSLFTFNIPNFSLVNLSGASVQKVSVKIEKTSYSQEGPLLITHRGFSGPAILKLSAFAARYLAEKNYEATLIIDWLPDYTENELLSTLLSHPKKQLHNIEIPLPKKLWTHFCKGYGKQVSALGKRALKELCQKLKQDRYGIKGKATNKEEFVTCGGVTLSEVNFKTMESKIHPGLYFCGEVLDIDGITGGFNFQNAWTTGWIAGSA